MFPAPPTGRPSSPGSHPSPGPTGGWHRTGRRLGCARALAFERLEGREVPATITVRNTNDSGPDSLRDAIERANALAGPDTIDFAPSVTGNITLANLLPELSTDIVLEGPGVSALTVARSAAPGTPLFRIFTVAAGAEVTISGLTLTGGLSRTAEVI